MTFHPETRTYTIERMLPSIEFEFYFTVNGVEKYQMTHQKQTPVDSGVELVFVNVMHNKHKNKRKLGYEFIKSVDCFPRPVRPDWPDDDDNKEPEWDIKNSVFWGYIPDSTEQLNKCFEYDWSH